MAKAKEKSKKKKHSKSKDEVKEKEIFKKHKPKSETPEKPNKSGKKHKKSKKSERKHRKREKSEVPESPIAHPDNALTTQTPFATNQSGSDTGYDQEDLRQLLESYSKEQLVDLICSTSQKGSRLISAVLESAERDVAQRRIFVHGLAWDTTRKNLEEAFQPYGEIEDCTVVMDKATGRAKGFGFVVFKTRKGAREALKNPYKRLCNRTMMCHLASKGASGSGKGREMAEPVKIDLPQMANQGQVLGYVHENVHSQRTGPILTGQSMPIVGHASGFLPVYGGLMGNPVLAGLPNYAAIGAGVMNHGLIMPPNHVDLVSEYAVAGAGAGAGAGAELAWHPVLH